MKCEEGKRVRSRCNVDSNCEALMSAIENDIGDFVFSTQNEKVNSLVDGNVVDLPLRVVEVGRFRHRGGARSRASAGKRTTGPIAAESRVDNDRHVLEVVGNIASRSTPECHRHAPAARIRRLRVNIRRDGAALEPPD